MSKLDRILARGQYKFRPPDVSWMLTKSDHAAVITTTTGSKLRVENYFRITLKCLKILFILPDISISISCF